MKKIYCAILLLLCLSLFGCGQKPIPTTAPPLRGPFQTGNPILTTRPSTVQMPITVSSAVVTIFEDTAIIARNPVMTWGTETEPLCPARDISAGGRIGCNDPDGKPYPIIRVIIMEDIVPASTRDWFRDLPQLAQIEGLAHVHTDLVTDMSYMFSGCVKLRSIDADGWNVSGVKNMTGIFDGCNAMMAKPNWYQ